MHPALSDRSQMDTLPEVQAGQQLDITTLFKEGDLVDVAGTSSGKGFQGGIKRWNMVRWLAWLCMIRCRVGAAGLTLPASSAPLLAAPWFHDPRLQVAPWPRYHRYALLG